MDNNIPEIKELIQQFSKLPGLGPKSAKRIILKLINNKDNMIKPVGKPGSDERLEALRLHYETTNEQSPFGE